MNETKKWFFEKINNTEKSLVTLTDGKKKDSKLEMKEILKLILQKHQRL